MASELTRECRRSPASSTWRETAFVRAPRDPVHTAALRIFTPTMELPFAGHPTFGAACLIAALRART